MKIYNYILFALLAFVSVIHPTKVEAGQSLVQLLHSQHLNQLIYERFIVASTIYMEARGEGKEGMRAVAAVIKQRAINGNDSLSAVCLKSYQFSCWNAYINTEPSFYESYAPLISNNQIEQRAAAVALDIAFSIDSLNTSYYNFVDHYHAKSVSPYWARGIKPAFTIKNHVFYRLSTKDQDH